MTVRIGVVTFPGSLDDRDARVAVTAGGAEAVTLWHADTDLQGVDAVVLPGGFSYGDYLRCGAVAHRAAIIPAIRDFADAGGPVLGICNGFQILCEAGLLPGALLRNEQLRFISKQVDLVVERDTPWTTRFAVGETITIPLKNGEGRYHASPETLAELREQGRIVFSYVDGANPNGSIENIAGISNEAGNVVGLMPHPEHAVDATLAGGAEGLPMFTGIVAMLRAAALTT